MWAVLIQWLLIPDTDNNCKCFVQNYITIVTIDNKLKLKVKRLSFNFHSTAAFMIHIYIYFFFNPITGLDGPCVFQKVEAPRFQDNRHKKVARLSALRTGHLYTPGNIPGTHFC